ncbi:hypothetical protein Clacol_001794 [Clathrus columnatus]|uniref:Major facilitator superfamily (MFS) profile domain-containing protein n=1 Tax=Clathrus columnatus TaxID=1419009 RepID=A0AAV4ZZ20_9AGAM|nr:hypothetical protein Clacol_001794 [Clathrus columnatus]
MESEKYSDSGKESPIKTEHFSTDQVKKLVHFLYLLAAFAAAAEEGKLNPWSRDSFYLYWMCFTSFLCSCANGYDGSLMTAINSMPFYQSRFNAGTLGSTTGLIFSMSVRVKFTTLEYELILTFQDSRFGRRGAMQIGGLLICLGTAIIASSTKTPQFIGGRFVLGFGVSILTCAAPSYIVEVSPPQWRGRLTAFYNLGWFGGSIPAAGITLGCQSIPSDWSWRLPLIFQAVPSVFVILSVFFLPESPRWLVANSRDDEALAFLMVGLSRTERLGNGLGYFNLQIYQAAVSAFAACCGVALSDRMPRRQVLIWGTLASAVFLGINGGLSLKWAHMSPDHVNLAVGQGANILNVTAEPSRRLYPVEVLQTTARAKGMSMIQLRLRWDCVEALLWYLFGVETVGRSLEELEELFSSPNPVAASKKKQIIAVKKTGGAAIIQVDHDSGA